MKMQNDGTLTVLWSESIQTQADNSEYKCVCSSSVLRSKVL